MRLPGAGLLLLLLSACGTDWYLQQGEDALREMDLEGAERSYRSALAREPDSSEALYGLGWTYHLAGFQDEARETFERCATVAPTSARSEERRVGKECRSRWSPYH